jgi:hypothetical protein
MNDATAQSPMNPPDILDRLFSERPPHMEYLSQATIWHICQEEERRETRARVKEWQGMWLI